MNGPLAQIVALTCHANAFLRGGTVGAFFPGNSTCNFCDRVGFVVVEKSFLRKAREKDFAKTPQEWFGSLRSAGAGGVRLLWRPQSIPRISDRMSAGLVGGGGTWSMEVLLPKSLSDFWVARWEVWNQNAPEQRIWRVTYGRVSRSRTRSAPPPDLGSATTNLRQALQEIHSFSSRAGCDGFTASFADALDALDSSPGNRRGYHADLAPAGYCTDEARAVLDACQMAWVFGGMGSWNDLGFDGESQKEYERVSERLFQTMCKAISEAATQSSHGSSKAM